MGEERDPAWVAAEDASVEERGDASLRRPDVVAVEALPPDVEEVAERVRALDREVWMIPSAASVCSHMKHGAPATKAPCGVASTWYGRAIPTPAGTWRAAPRTKIVRWA